jgi:hypothetical protein
MPLLHHSMFLSISCASYKPTVLPSIEYGFLTTDCVMVQGPVSEQIVLSPAHHFVLFPIQDSRLNVLLS